MKKLRDMISGRDALFGIVIFTLVIVISIFQPSNKIKVSFGQESVDIRSSRYTMNVPYTMVESIELVTKPDMGQPVDGHDDMILLTGTWENETWGVYQTCSEIATDNCIVIALTDGRTFVISRRDNEETAAVFAEFQTHLG